MTKILSEEEIADIRKRADGPPEPSYLSLSQPFDSSPDDAWCSAYEDLDNLLRSHEELRRRMYALYFIIKDMRDEELAQFGPKR